MNGFFLTICASAVNPTFPGLVAGLPLEAEVEFRLVLPRYALES
jgi:hypothetical protein